MRKIVHIFDETTGNYLFDYDCYPDPENPGAFIEPIASTDDPLPAKVVKKWPRRVNDAWTLVDDFRGEIWFSGYNQPVEVTEVGTPSGITKTEPPAPPPPRGALIAFAKAEAQKRIIAIEAQWNDVNYVVKQLNALMVSVDFVFDIVQRASDNGGLVSLTPEDMAVSEQLRGKKAQIEAIRAASDLVEQDITDGLITDERGVVSSVRWP